MKKKATPPAIFTQGAKMFINLFKTPLAAQHFISDITYEAHTLFNATETKMAAGDSLDPLWDMQLISRHVIIPWAMNSHKPEKATTEVAKGLFELYDYIDYMAIQQSLGGLLQALGSTFKDSILSRESLQKYSVGITSMFYLANVFHQHHEIVASERLNDRQENKMLEQGATNGVNQRPQADSVRKAS